MLTNAKVGTKLLALIVAPVVVLLAVASLGARDRLDEAGAAEQVESAAELTALTDAVVRSLGTERLLTVAQVAGSLASVDLRWQDRISVIPRASREDS